MRDRVPESLRRLSGEQPAGAVGDGAGNHDRQADAELIDDVRAGEDRRLGVERIEDRLDEQDIDAAFDQSTHLLSVSDAQLIERDGAEAWIEHVGRDRRGTVGRTNGAGNETRTAILVLGNLRRMAREARAFEIELVGDLRHAVVGLRDAGRGEGVGRDNIRAGAEIGEVNGANRVRTTQIEQIVVAAHLAVPGVETRAPITAFVETKRLNYRAHCAVEHQNALSGETAQGRLSIWPDCHELRPFNLGGQL